MQLCFTPLQQINKLFPSSHALNSYSKTFFFQLIRTQILIETVLIIQGLVPT